MSKKSMALMVASLITGSLLYPWGQGLAADLTTEQQAVYDAVMEKLQGTDSIEYVSVNGATATDTNKDNKGATKMGGIAIGANASNQGSYSLAVGHGANITTGGSGQIAIGYKATTLGGSSTIAIGHMATAKEGMAIGYDSYSDTSTSLALGMLSKANKQSSVSVGYMAVSNDKSTALGNHVESYGGDSTAIGSYARAYKGKSIASGYQAATYSKNSIAIGSQATVYADNSKYVLSRDYEQLSEEEKANYALDPEYINQGGKRYYKLGEDTYGIAMGYKAKVKATNGLAIGKMAVANKEGGVALGSNSVARIEAGVMGYDPSTGKDSTKDTSTWKSTLGALSLGHEAPYNGKIGTRQINYVAAGTNDTDAVNVAQLKLLREAGLNFKGDSPDVLHRGLSEQLNIVGGATIADLTDNNIGVVADVDPSDNTKITGLRVKLAKNLALTDGSVAFAETAKDADGNLLVKGQDGNWYTDLTDAVYDEDSKSYTKDNATISPVEQPNVGAVKLSSTGLDNGNQRITNVAEGTEDTDAVNVAQLKKVTDEISDQGGDVTKLKAGFKVAAGSAKTDVTLGGDTAPTITFIGDDNVTATLNGTTVKYELNKTGITSTLGDTFVKIDASNLTGDMNINNWKTKLGITSTALDQASAWTLYTNKGTEKESMRTISKGSIINFVGSENIEVTATSSGADVTVDLNKVTKDKINKIDGLESKVNNITNNGIVTKIESDGSGVIVTPKDKNDASKGVTVGLNDKITVGGITIDGTKANGGGTASHTITGLTNTTWDGKTFESGRAATEDQLHVVEGNITNLIDNITDIAGATTIKEGDGNIKALKTEGKNEYTLSLNKDVTVENSISVGGNEYITKDGINANNQVITNVGEGKLEAGSKNAATVNQVVEVRDQLTEQIGGVATAVQNNARQISHLDSKINKAGAGAAALAALHPLDFDPDNKWNFTAGVGTYHGSSSVALGAFYRPNEETMFSIGGAIGNGEDMMNFGVSMKFGESNPYAGMSRGRLIEYVEKQTNEIDALRAQNETQNERIQKLEELVQSLVAG